jgi:hypothetical protein
MGTSTGVEDLPFVKATVRSDLHEPCPNTAQRHARAHRHGCWNCDAHRRRVRARGYAMNSNGLTPFGCKRNWVQLPNPLEVTSTCQTIVRGHRPLDVFLDDCLSREA